MRLSVTISGILGITAVAVIAACDGGGKLDCSDKPLGPACSSSLSRGDCMSEGGCWVQYYGGKGCSCPTTDASDPCSTSAECEGSCVVGYGNMMGTTCGDATGGHCSDHRPVVGCYCYLDDSGVGMDICVD